jgi:hypothetical protein
VLLLLTLLVIYHWKIPILVVLPLILVAFSSCVFIFFQLTNVMIFGYDFSNLGHYKRTLQPDEMAIVASTSSIGIGGGVRLWPLLCIWTVYPSGLGISINGVGEAFVSISKISQIRKTSSINKLLMIPGYEIFHTSPEIISPLDLSEKIIVDELQKLLDQRNALEGQNTSQ